MGRKRPRERNRMKGEVRSIHLVDYDDWQYWPEDPSDFCVAAEALVGPEGGIGADIFSFEVCSPRWFEKNRGEKGTFVRHILLINEYDPLAIKKVVDDIVSMVSGENWNEVAILLARFMFWEFEDYKV